MAVLSFKVQADYERVVRLREEIVKLEAELRSVGKNTPSADIKSLEARLASAKGEFSSLATEAAKAGRTIEAKFKSEMRSASQAVNDLSRQILEQKAVVKDTEYNVRKLSEAYQKAQLSGRRGKASELSEELNAAKKALEEDKIALFDLTQQQAKARLSVKELKDTYAEFKEEAEETSEASEGFNMSLGKIAGLVGGAEVLRRLGSEIVRVRGQFQEMETAITTLVGEATADKLMPQIRELAKVSPLTMTDIVGAEKMMLGFNIEAEKTIDYLKAISDVSMGNSQKFNSLTLAFSQMSAAGKLMGQDLNQMINAGFNPLQAIAQKTGKSIAQLKVEMSKGAISAEMVQQAFLDATSAGGKFYKMSENASKTINGQISMLQDAMDAAFNELGEASEELIMKGIKTATPLVQNYETIGKVLAGLVITYGTYRTAVIVTTLAEKARTTSLIGLTKSLWEGSKAQAALNASMLTNPYVLMATAILGMAAAITAHELAANSARKAQKALNDAIDESQEASMGELRELAKLRGELKACEKGTEEYNKVKNQIVQKYGSYHSNLEQEITEVGLLDETYKSLTDSITAAFGARQFDKFIKQQEEGLDKTLASKFSKIYKRLTKDLGEEAGAELYTKIHRALLAGEQLDEQTSATLDRIQNKGKLSADSRVDGWINDIRNEMELFKKVESDARIKFGVEEKKDDKTSDGDGEGKKSTYQEDFEAAKKKYEADLAAFTWAEKNKTKITTEEYEKRKKELASSEEAFKKLGGKTEKAEAQSDNQRLEQQEKIQKLQTDADKERVRSAKDMEFMVEQARIDAMKDGAEKRRAQRQLDNAKELEELEREKQDYIDKVVEREKAIFDAKEDQKAKNNDKYKKQTFNEAAAREGVDTTSYDNAIALTVKRQGSQQDEVLKDLLNRYKAYEDKKQQIIISYLEESDELQAMYEETGDERYKRSLEERHRAYVQDLNKLEKEFDDSYKIIFRDPSKMTKGGLYAALELAEKKLQELIQTGAEANVLDPLYAQIKAIREELDNYDIGNIVTDLNSLVKQADNLSKAKKRLEGLDKSSDLYSKEKEAVDRMAEDLKKSLVATGVSEFASLMTDAAKAMHQIAKESGDVELEELASVLEKTGGIINSSIQGLMQAGPWGLLVGLVSSAVGAIANLAVEAEAADARLASGLRDFRRELELTQLQIDSVDFESIFGTQQFEAASEALLKAKEAISMFEAESEKLRSLSWKYGTGISWFPEEGVLFETYDKLEGLHNKDIWDENGMLDVEKARAFLESSKTITDEARKQVEHAIELREAYDAAMAILDDFLASFVGSASQDIADAIFEGIDNGSDAWDIFEEKGAETIRALGKQMLKEMIQKDLTTMWEDRLRAAAGDPEELAKTYTQMMEWIKTQMQGYQAAAAQWEAQYGDMYEAAQSQSQQEASRKGYETLSEDTGNELVGRAIAQYESNLRIEESVRGMSESVDRMASNYIQMRDIAAESRAIIADSFLELQQIRDNTSRIIRPIINLSEKIDKWDSKIMDL